MVKYRRNALYISYSLQILVKGMNCVGSTQTRKMKTCPHLTNDIVVHTPTCPYSKYSYKVKRQYLINVFILIYTYLYYHFWDKYTCSVLVI